MNFKQDINGLRAFAVAGVVLYRFGDYPFRGGFVGVDVFFVISGLLLASLSPWDVRAGRYSAGRYSASPFLNRCRCKKSPQSGLQLQANTQSDVRPPRPSAS
jgi:peptidoglycan/LPS O-acetylase OafA/YrhL